MKQSKLVVLVLLILVATPLMHLCGTVSAQSYGEDAYGGRTYNDWQTAEQDLETPQNRGSQEDTGQSPGIVIVPETDENDSSEELQIDPATSDEDDIPVDTNDSTDQSDDDEEDLQDLIKRSALPIWLSIGAVLLALLIFLIALLRRRRDDRN